MDFSREGSKVCLEVPYSRAALQCFGRGAELYGDLLRAAVAVDGQLHGVAGVFAVHGSLEIVVAGDGFAIDGGDQVAADAQLHIAHDHGTARPANSRFFRGGIALDLLDQQATFRRKVERLRQVSLHKHCLDAQERARDLAACFFEHGLGAVDGHGETDSDIALRSVNRGVDADDVAVGIEQRSAAIAGIDGGIGLDHVLERASVFIGDRTVKRADNAGGERTFEAERIADGQDFLADLQRVGIAEAENRQAFARLDLHESEIVAVIGKHHAGFVLFLIGQGHGELMAAQYDVVVGENFAIGTDDSPGIAATFFQPDPAKAKLGIIDPSRINSVAKAYIAAGLIPTSPTGLVSTQEGASDNQNELTVKLDYNLNAKDKISGSFGLFRNPTLNPFNFATVSGYADLTESRIYFLNLAYTRVFSPTLLNEFHAIFHRSNFTQDTPSTTLPTPNALGIGIHSDNPVGPTNLLFDSGLDIGFSENGPTRFVDNTYAYTDTVSWTRGKHNWKFGAGFSAFQDNTVFDFIINGEFDFNAGGGIGSQNDLADFLLGIPGSYFQAAAAPNNIRSKNTYVFGQDEWHVLKNLVVTLGLRYEYSTPKSDTEGRSFSIVPGARSTVFPNAPTGLLFPGDAGAPSGSNFPDKNDFAPRVGFAWDPRGDGKTSLRGGIGVFYDILKGEDNLQFNGQPPFVGSAGLFFNPLDANPTTQLNYLTQPFAAAGVPDSFPSKRPPANLDFAQAGFLPFGSNGFLFMVDPHLRTPYIYQYNLSLQHEVFRDTVMEASYVGSSSHKLTSLQDINPMVLGTTNRILNLAPRNSTCDDNGGLCSFSGLPEFRNVSHANYNSLQASLTRQVKKSKLGTAYFTFAYTYAHNLDNVSGFRQRNSTVPAYDPDHFYASADSDIRHRISFSGGWDLPFDEAWTSGPKRLTKGWSLYPIVTWRAGFPFDIPARLPDRFDYLNPGTSGAGDPLLSNADIVGPTNTFDPRKSTTLDFGGTPTTGNFYFNPNSFSHDPFLADNFDPVNNPSQRTYGTLPRNFLRGPHQTNFDLAVAKTTPLIGERLKAEFRVEFFNILNHPEFANPDVNVNSDTFGQITTTGSFRSPAPRIIQLAARLTF